jgi:hypothetical protein
MRLLLTIPELEQMPQVPVLLMVLLCFLYWAHPIQCL